MATSTLQTVNKTTGVKTPSKIMSREIMTVDADTLEGRPDILQVCSLTNGFGVWTKDGVRMVNRTTFEDYIVDPVVDWCLKRPGERLTYVKAAQLGLTDVGDKNGVMGPVAAVQRIVMSKGHSGRLGPKGHVLGGEYGMVYGSAEGQCGSLDIKQNWFPIKLCTLKIKSDPEASDPVDDKVDEEDKGPLGYSVIDGVLELALEDPEISLDRMFKWLTENKGRVLFVEGAKARADAAEAAKHVVDDLRVHFHSRRDHCMALSLLNAATITRGFEKGSKTLGTITTDALCRLRRKCTMAGLANWVQAHMEDLCLLQLNDSNGNARGADSFYLDRVFDDFEKGVYLVRLVGTSEGGGGRIDHVIVVDMYKKLIWDSYEPHPLRLSKSALLCCVGDGVDSVDIRDVRELVKLYSVGVDGRRIKNSGATPDKRRGTKGGKVSLVVKKPIGK